MLGSPHEIALEHHDPSTVAHADALIRVCEHHFSVQSCRSCCSMDLLGTKRMLGRLTASQIASASLASFFKGLFLLTNC